MLNKIIFADNAAFNGNDDIVFCYGHFNLIHPGHLRYLQHAKTLANKLIVVIRSDEELDKDSFGQHFTEDERAESVANLQIVDGVIILNQLTLDKLVDIVKPSVLVLGKEFEQKQPKYISSAISAVRKQGKTVFHAGEAHYATSNLLHGNVLDIEKTSVDSFKAICKNHKLTLNTLQDRLNSFPNSKLLVIGDTIVDNYVACDALGMSAEAPVLVVKELENREFIGGAAIVASHVRALGAKCHYISVVGDDLLSSSTKEVLNNRDIDTSLIIDPSRPTTYKTRYMVENQKLFRVSRIKDHNISEKIENEVINKLNELAPDIDGIMVSDFVYGVITPNILTEILHLAKEFNLKLFGDLQCSSQVGKVTKFNKFDLITPTEKESRIALDDNESGIDWIANKLIKDTNSKNMLMKLGPDGFIAYNNEKLMKRQNFPALTVNPVDVTGAGDSLFAAMSVSLVSNASLIEASAIGACMASLAVQEVGNIPITKDRLDSCIIDILG
ncbi:adenylyltransferase/cytidyltransferase family protein [Candidatus Woesearchaeota archaeon]|nr:adenylyltransferase/cytidyltransferase family protein [Candidatus Woesearchaeota archaeon]